MANAYNHQIFQLVFKNFNSFSNSNSSCLKKFQPKISELEHHNSQNSDYLRFGGENGILANQLSKILKSPLLIFFIKIPKSPLKFIFLKRSPKSGEKRMVIFGGENGISPDLDKYKRTRKVSFVKCKI